MISGWTRLLAVVTATLAALGALVAAAPAASAAQECSCRDDFVGDLIAAADGVFIGTITDLEYGDGAVVTPANPAERTTYDVAMWIKGALPTSTVEVHRGSCDDGVAEVGDEIAVAFGVDGSGRAVHTCALPPAPVVQAFVQPDAAAPGPAVYFATSRFAPPLLLDAAGRIVASDPNADNRRIEVAAGCPDGTVAYLQDDEVVIVDATFSEVERLQWRRLTDELFCPEPGVILAIAGPSQERQVYDVRSRSPLTSQLTFGSPADAVGDLVAGAMESPGDANATVRVVNRSSGIERVLIDPSLVVDARPVSVVSVRLSPGADRVAFTVTTGPEESARTTVMVADTAGGSILASADVGTRRAHVRWLSPDRLVVQTTTGRSSVLGAARLEVELELDARWIQHLDDNVLSGIGDSQRGGPGVGTTLTRLSLPDGAPTVERALPFEMQVRRLPTPVDAGATGPAFVEALDLPLPSERLDGLVPTATADGMVFVAPEPASATTAPVEPGSDRATEAAGDEAAAEPAGAPSARPDDEDAGILMWAVAAGAITLGGVLLVLARRPTPGP